MPDIAVHVVPREGSEVVIDANALRKLAQVRQPERVE
jgi:hypothetical protein